MVVAWWLVGWLRQVVGRVVVAAVVAVVGAVAGLGWFEGSQVVGEVSVAGCW